MQQLLRAHLTGNHMDFRLGADAGAIPRVVSSPNAGQPNSLSHPRRALHCLLVLLAMLEQVAGDSRLTLFPGLRLQIASACNSYSYVFTNGADSMNFRLNGGLSLKGDGNGGDWLMASGSTFYYNSGTTANPTSYGVAANTWSTVYGSGGSFAGSSVAVGYAPYYNRNMAGCAAIRVHCFRQCLRFFSFLLVPAGFCAHR